MPPHALPFPRQCRRSRRVRHGSCGARGRCRKRAACATARSTSAAALGEHDTPRFGVDDVDRRGTEGAPCAPRRTYGGARTALHAVSDMIFSDPVLCQEGDRGSSRPKAHVDRLCVEIGSSPFSALWPSLTFNSTSAADDRPPARNVHPPGLQPFGQTSAREVSVQTSREPIRCCCAGHLFLSSTDHRDDRSEKLSRIRRMSAVSAMIVGSTNSRRPSPCRRSYVAPPATPSPMMPSTGALPWKADQGRIAVGASLPPIASTSPRRRDRRPHAVDAALDVHARGAAAFCPELTNRPTPRRNARLRSVVEHDTATCRQLQQPLQMPAAALTSAETRSAGEGDLVDVGMRGSAAPASPIALNTLIKPSGTPESRKSLQHCAESGVSSAASTHAAAGGEAGRLHDALERPVPRMIKPTTPNARDGVAGDILGKCGDAAVR